jgi:uncharacterized protein Yka (UPF0111/DUF47 family)
MRLIWISILDGKVGQRIYTPIEREDIMMIVQKIDDVTDAIEDVLLQVYMFNIRTIRPDATDFSQIIVKCCDMTKKVSRRLQKFPQVKNYP